MTAGISGTGPYAQLRTLKTLAEHCAYELREFRHGPRKRAALERLAADIAGRIARVRASIKAAGERSYERMNAMDIDTADHVHHAPSGEDWVVGLDSSLTLPGLPAHAAAMASASA